MMVVQAQAMSCLVVSYDWCSLSSRAPTSFSASAFTRVMVDGLAALAAAPRPAARGHGDRGLSDTMIAIYSATRRRCALSLIHNTSCLPCWAKMPVRCMSSSNRRSNTARAKRVNKNLAGS